MRHDIDIETMHHLSSRRGYEERSVTVEQQSNRFLSVSRRIEMTAAITGATFPTWGEMSAGQRGSVKVNYNNSHHLTAVNAVPSAWKAEKLGPETSMLLSSRQSPEISGEERSVTVEQQSNRFLSVSRRIEMTAAITGATFPTWGEMSAGQRGSEALTPPHRCKRGPLRLEAGAGGDGVEVKTNKNAHSFQKETVSKRDNNLSLFFLISQHALKCEKFSPLGEMSASWRTEGYRLVANKKKSSAYET
nr:hypothetical protein [uncultured Draconibacterium sp.]